MPAGHVLVVGLVCFLVATLLDAESLLRTARSQPFGTKRTVSVAIARPVHAISTALSLDRPRRAVESALGRDREPPATVIAAPSVPAASVPPGPAPTDGPASPAAPTTPATPTPPSIPSGPRVLWVAGDSVAGKFAQSLVRLATDRMEASLDFRLATGLTRPDVFDWPTHISEEVASLHATAVVIMIGGNDDQGMVTDEASLSYGGDAWRQEYGRRVAQIMRHAGSTGACLYWVGLPIMRSESLSNHAAMVNEIVQQQAAAHPRTVYIDSWTLFTDGDGKYASHLEDSEGKLQQVRENDGVHLTRVGGDRLAQVVLPKVEAGC